MDIIRLLSDTVANQIAAGEVIQRPASVVKELVENALDADATEISIIIKDAGRTLIQVIDNGKGMSATDARMAFERHATSKIAKAEDLFKITTMGFRGEALASIAAVSSVELKTKREDDQVGVSIHIAGSQVTSQDAVACAKGANFMIKNLFYNIPARRKFLKSDKIEYKHISTEIYRIVLTNPDVNFNVIFDSDIELQLNSENLRQRIINVFGKKLNIELINIQSESSIAKIKGFIGKPERSKKTNSEQFFFVNNRYMNHPYFRKAVYMAYDKLLPEGENPSFFIYIDVNPANIDINIHPTKTEIKFEEEQAIFQILNSTIKEALGKFNIVPAIDFDDTVTTDVHLTPNTTFKAPNISINSNYNPFIEHSEFNERKNFRNDNTPRNWETLYTPSAPQSYSRQSSIDENENISIEEKNCFIQFKNKYIITTGKSGLIIIDQKLAHERILYDKFMSLLVSRRGVVQRTLLPIIYTPNSESRAILLEVLTELNNIGFEIVMQGKENFEIQGVPADLIDFEPIKILEDLIYVLETIPSDIKMILHEKIALSLSKSASMKTNKTLCNEEMQSLFYGLMSCPNSNYTSEGKKIIEIINIEEIEKKLI